MSSKAPFFRIAFLLLALGSSSSSRAQAKSYDIGGKVLWPGDEVAASKIKLILSTNGEIVRYGWTRGDGRFKIPNVPVGSHLLELSALGLLYPELRVDVSADGKVLATLADNELQRLPEPLIIRPAGRAEYFEKRTPFNVISFIKTPYGLMIMFGIFAVFVLPKMKVDPEEYKELVDSAKSLTSNAQPAQQASPSRQQRISER
ncbi:g11776 [Coccomyxa viridis]|uniref:G11776 protein n=1 Tax=Coccomyxa viridis TaxID=1274662 RepID=A0ABP1GFS5_9CHLO